MTVMRSVLVSFIFLVVLFIALPQIGVAVLNKSYKEQSAYLFSDGVNENATIVEPITRYNQNIDSDEIVANADVTALIKFTCFMHELSEIKNQTIECTLSKIFFELNEDSAFQETPNNIENDEVVYFVAVKPSENNDLNQFLIREMPLKDFSAYLKISDMLLWVSSKGTRIHNQGMRESLGMYSPSIQLLTKQHSLLLQSHGDENFLLYFPCSVKDTSTNHYTRTSYAFFLFEKYDSDLRSYPCILRALAGSNDIDEDRVAERVGNDTLYSKRVSGTTIETCQNGDLWIKCGGECNIGCRYKSSLEAACVEYIANHMIKHKIKACFMDDKSGKPYAFIVYMAMKSKMNTHDYKQILEYPPAVNMLLEKTGQNFDAIHQAKNKIQLFLTNEEAQIQAEEQHAARLMEMTTTQLLSDLSCVQQSKSVADTIDYGTLPNYQPVDHRTTPNLPAGMLSDLRCHISQVANVENQNHDAKLLSGIMNSQDKCSDYNIEKEILEGNKAGPLVNNTASAGSNKAGSDSILHDGERRYGDTGTNKLPKQRIAYSAAPSHHCDICKKSFQYKSKLQSHMISHCKDQPYICGICGNQFKVTSSLTRHMLSHIEDQPYTCEICGKSGQGGFRSHMRIHMYTPADEKPYYRCEICATKFGSLSHLKVHMNIHTKEKSYSCEICGKEFGRNANLGRHMRIHTGEKLYSCDVCGMDLGRKADLNKHMAFHSSAKYSCDICNKPFKDHKSLTRHVRHIHKK